VLAPVRGADGRAVGFRIVYANAKAADILGRPIAAFVGRSLAEAFPEAVGTDVWRNLLRVAETGEPFEATDLEYRSDLAGGARGYYELRASRYLGDVVVAHRDTTAVRRRDFASARQLAEAQFIREAFLPRSLPHSHELDIAAGFQPASNAPLGGDWYDAFTVDAGICLVVGDVAGHGLPAAAVMAQLRPAVRAFANEDASPGRVLERVNRMMLRLLPGSTATAILAVWDPGRRTVTRARAGHPPVLLCRPGEASFLEPIPPGRLLGATPDSRYVDVPLALPEAATLVFYTDGLIESRGEGLDQGMERLRGHVEQLPDLSPEALCKELLSWSVAYGRHDDDVCVLAVRLA